MVVASSFLLFGCYGDAAICVEGHVIDASGNPIQDASVTLAPAEDSDVEYRPWTTSTDESGEFSTITMTYSPAARTPTFVVTVEKDGYKSVKKHFASGGLFADQSITLEPVEK